LVGGVGANDVVGAFDGLDDNDAEGDIDVVGAFDDAEGDIDVVGAFDGGTGTVVTSNFCPEMQWNGTEQAK